MGADSAEHFDSSLRRALAKRGFGVREARELAHECADHLRDLREELRAAGVPESRIEAESSARMGEIDRIAEEFAERDRRDALIGSPALSSALATPPALTLILVAASVLACVAAQAFLSRVAGVDGVRGVADDPALWRWVFPSAFQLAGSLILCALFRRTRRRIAWSALACLAFSAVSSPIYWNVAFGEPGVPASARPVLWIGLVADPPYLLSHAFIPVAACAAFTLGDGLLRALRGRIPSTSSRIRRRTRRARAAARTPA